MTESDLFLELQVDDQPVTRLEAAVPRFHPLTPDDIARTMAAVDRDQPMKLTEGLDEVGVEYYRREYKAWHVRLQKHLAEQGVKNAYAHSHRCVAVAARVPEGSTITATITGPLQVMDAYEHETSFYEDRPMFEDPPEPPTWPVERQSWWGEEAEFGVGQFVPQEPYRLPQHIEWTPEEGEVRRELLVMVPADAEDAVQGELVVCARAPDGRCLERRVAIHLTSEWIKVGSWHAEGLAEIGVDLNKEG